MCRAYLCPTAATDQFAGLGGRDGGGHSNEPFATCVFSGFSVSHKHTRVHGYYRPSTLSFAHSAVKAYVQRNTLALQGYIYDLGTERLIQLILSYICKSIGITNELYI